MKIKFACFLSICFVYVNVLSAAEADVKELLRKIQPSDKNIHLIGRFSPDYKFSWTGCGFVIKVKGGDVNVLLKDSANGKKHKRIGYNSNYFAVKVDDQEPSVLRLEPGVERYALLTNSDGKEHVITLFKRTEALFGTVQFKGLELAKGAKLLPPPIKKKRLLALGDSITCGYGNECPKKEWGFTAAEENGYMTYAAIAARNLDAEYQCVAWSGQGLYRNRQNSTKNQMPDQLMMTIPNYYKKDWDLKKWVPDYLVVNLGTNDTAKGIPPEKEYLQAANQLVEKILKLNPKCQIYFLVGPMVSKDKKKALLKYYQTVADKNKQVFMVKLPSPKWPDEFGGHYHPKVACHQRCAKVLTEAIKKNN